VRSQAAMAGGYYFWPLMQQLVMPTEWRVLVSATDGPDGKHDDCTLLISTEGQLRRLPVERGWDTVCCLAGGLDSF